MYLECVQAVKSYIGKTGLTVKKNGLTELTKTLHIISSTRESGSLCYEVITQNLNKPNCCGKWEAKLKISTRVPLLRKYREFKNGSRLD